MKSPADKWRHTLWLVALLLVAAPVWGAEGAPSTLTLRAAVDTALARAALVRTAEQSLADAVARLERAKARTPMLVMGANSSEESTGGLDPESEITGTSYSSQEYDSALTLPLHNGAALTLSSSAYATVTNSGLRSGGGTEYAYAGASLGADLAQPLSLFRNERILATGPRRTAELAVRGAQVSVIAARQRVALEAITRFLVALEASRQADLAAEVQARAKELRRIAQERLARGQIAEIEVMEAGVAADAAAVATRTARATAETAADDLHTYLGLPLGMPVKLQYDPEKEPIAGTDLEEEALVGRALELRSDLRLLSLNTEAADIAWQQAEAASRPGVSLRAGYARSGEAGDISESFQRLLNPAWYAGVLTTMPLSRREGEASVAAAQSAREVARTDEVMRREEVRAEIRRLLREVRNAQANAAALTVTLRTAEENVRIRQVQFAHGLVRPLEVTQTEQQLNQVSTQRLAALIDLQLARARLCLALGEMPTLDGGAL